MTAALVKICSSRCSTCQVRCSHDLRFMIYTSRVMCRIHAPDVRTIGTGSAIPGREHTLEAPCFMPLLTPRLPHSSDHDYHDNHDQDHNQDHEHHQPHHQHYHHRHHHHHHHHQHHHHHHHCLGVRILGFSRVYGLGLFPVQSCRACAGVCVCACCFLLKPFCALLLCLIRAWTCSDLVLFKFTWGKKFGSNSIF